MELFPTNPVFFSGDVFRVAMSGNYPGDSSNLYKRSTNSSFEM
jgi:hypothetical protein